MNIRAITRNDTLGLWRPIEIDGREIGFGNPPYIVAELSCNHNGEYGRMLEMIDAAQSAGADAVKFQAYTPEELSKPGAPLWDLYQKAQTPREWFPDLFEYCRKARITCFASAFSVEGVKFLETLDAPAYKIASPEIIDSALIGAARSTGKPVIISMGMADKLDLLKLAYANMIFLHCVAEYPATIESANLRAIATLQSTGQQCIGLSDHTPGIETAIAATALGAVMIEKHFKLDDGCIDAAFSLNPVQFAAMCKAVRAIHAGMGDGVIRPTCKPRQK